MNKKILFSLGLLGLSTASLSQDFAPAAGQQGSTAIHKDSSVFVSWASHCEVTRGLLNIEDPSLGLATFGTPAAALGVATGISTDVISLGDGGNAVLTFPTSIRNGEGPDFAVFENGVTDNFLEIGFVEVSSDGQRYVRFPAVSNVAPAPQIGSFGSIDCRYIHNFAGKYRVGFGTPFDLEDLLDSTDIDLNAITHIRIVDVIGSIDPQFASYDSKGNVINNLHPTPFESSGFDLEAVGVIHQALLSVNDVASNLHIYPNPVSDRLTISSNETSTLSIYSLVGKLMHQEHVTIGTNTIDCSLLPTGLYYIQMDSGARAKFLKK